MISGSSDGTIKVWNTLDGKALATLEGHHRDVWAVTVTQQPAVKIVSASFDRTVKLWDPLVIFQHWRWKRRRHFITFLACCGFLQLQNSVAGSSATALSGVGASGYEKTTDNVGLSIDVSSHHLSSNHSNNKLSPDNSMHSYSDSNSDTEVNTPLALSIQVLNNYGANPNTVINNMVSSDAQSLQHSLFKLRLQRNLTVETETSDDSSSAYGKNSQQNSPHTFNINNSLFNTDGNQKNDNNNNNSSGSEDTHKICRVVLATKGQAIPFTIKVFEMMPLCRQIAAFL